MASSPGERQRLLYGRRRGRRLRPGQRALLDTLLPRLAIPLPEAPGALDPVTLFPGPCRDVWIEIGFGGGEHLAWQARRHPGIGMIGCEPFLNGVASLLRRVQDDELRNIRLFTDDARLLLEALAPQSLGRAFILFPDPWPKKRHHKRRIVSGETLDALARLLKDGAELRVASDDPGYVRWILEHALGHAEFEWPARTARDWRERPADWPETRYEAKARAQGRAAFFFRFRRRPRAGEGTRPGSPGPGPRRDTK